MAVRFMLKAFEVRETGYKVPVRFGIIIRPVVFNAYNSFHFR